MAKRGQTYPYRVRYEWTTGIKGMAVASSLDEANLKADQIEGAGIRHPDADVTITIVRITGAGELIIGTHNTATQP